MSILTQPWPWYIAGPLIGLIIPILLLTGNKSFGVSLSFRHVLAALSSEKTKYFKYNWKAEIWNLYLVLGITVGGFIAWHILRNQSPIHLSEQAINFMNRLGIENHTDLIPVTVFNFPNLLTLRGFLLMIVGGFLIGFGTRYAGGCTSGHSIMGLSNLQLASLVATCCFFIGGTIMTWFILPYLMSI